MALKNSNTTNSAVGKASAMKNPAVGMRNLSVAELKQIVAGAPTKGGAAKGAGLFGPGITSIITKTCLPHSCGYPSCGGESIAG